MFDLDAYLDRIALPRPAEPSLPSLRAVTAAHTAAIPFENLDIMLGRPVCIDLASVQDKLVRRRRGGYCFEQNTLLKAALDALGFHTTMLMGRVVMGAAETDDRPRTHVMVKVALPEGAFLADVGFGNLTPTWPLALVPDRVQTTPLEAFRILVRPGYSVVQADFDDEWRPLYRYTDDPSTPADHVAANWFTSTFPGSPFTNAVIAARPGQGCRQTLINTRFNIRRMTGVQINHAKETCTLDSVEQARDTLRTHFNLALPDQDAESLFAAMRRCAETPHPAFRMDG
ncbi:MAG TPA: arylamine N-acetyltransferase [Rhodopila sp.]|nr:arylamine N-acetyltransferase [Rhodopila sp.]